MPNIELHGFRGRYFVQGSAFDVNGLVLKIHDMFSGKDYSKDMVVGVCPDVAVDRYGRQQPFIRVVNTREEVYTAEIISMLKKLNVNVDIESAVLEAFYPKEESGVED